MNNAQSLSVIICTRNRPRQLYNILKQLKNQTYPPDEIVLVENITEKQHISKELLSKLFRKTRVYTRYIPVNNRNCAYSRNRGLAQAHGDIVVYIDDDIRMPATFLAKTHSLHVRYSRAAGFSPFFSPTQRNTWTRFFAAFFNQGKKQDVNGVLPIITAPSAAMSLRRSALAGIRFDVHLHIGEDTDFLIELHKKGKRIYYTPQLCVAHEFPATPLLFFRRFFLYARNYLYLAQKQPQYISLDPYLPERRRDVFLFPVFFVSRLFGLSRRTLSDYHLSKKYIFVAFVYHLAIFFGTYSGLRGIHMLGQRIYKVLMKRVITD